MKSMLTKFNVGSIWSQTGNAKSHRYFFNSWKTEQQSLNLTLS